MWGLLIYVKEVKGWAIEDYEEKKMLGIKDDEGLMGLGI